MTESLPTAGEPRRCCTLHHCEDCDQTKFAFKVGHDSMKCGCGWEAKGRAYFCGRNDPVQSPPSPTAGEPTLPQLCARIGEALAKATPGQESHATMRRLTEQYIDGDGALYFVRIHQVALHFLLSERDQFKAWLARLVDEAATWSGGYEAVALLNDDLWEKVAALQSTLAGVEATEREQDAEIVRLTNRCHELAATLADAERDRLSKFEDWMKSRPGASWIATMKDVATYRDGEAIARPDGQPALVWTLPQFHRPRRVRARGDTEGTGGGGA